MAVSTLLLAHLTPHSGPCEHALPRVRRMREDLAVHEPMLRATARHLCRKAWETDDLVQDTFERALKHLEAGRPPPTQMRPWLASILRNAFIDRIRRKAVAFEPIADPAQPAADAAPDRRQHGRESVVSRPPGDARRARAWPRGRGPGSGGEMTTAAWKPEEIDAFAAGALAEEHHERVLAALAADPKAAAELEQC